MVQESRFLFHKLTSTFSTSRLFCSSARLPNPNNPNPNPNSNPNPIPSQSQFSDAGYASLGGAVLGICVSLHYAGYGRLTGISGMVENVIGKVSVCAGTASARACVHVAMFESKTVCAQTAANHS